MGIFDGFPVPPNKAYLREELTRIDEIWAAARFDSLPHVVHILTSKDREAEVQFLKEQSDIVEDVVDEVVQSYHGGFNRAIQNYSQAASSSPTTDFTGQRNTRDKRKDDTVAVIRGRQVKITEGASMYSLCRSWMKNGADEESQPPPPPSDVIMTLPKPLPPSTGDTQMSDKKEGEEEQADEKEDEESVEHLSIEDLLKRHVDRAKKVRAEFRQKRLNRIARYKNRLALLLPPMAEPQSNNDASSGSKDAATGNLPPGHD